MFFTGIRNRKKRLYSDMVGNVDLEKISRIPYATVCPIDFPDCEMLREYKTFVLEEINNYKEAGIHDNATRLLDNHIHDTTKEELGLLDKAYIARRDSARELVSRRRGDLEEIEALVTRCKEAVMEAAAEFEYLEQQISAKYGDRQRKVTAFIKHDAIEEKIIGKEA